MLVVSSNCWRMWFFVETSQLKRHILTVQKLLNFCRDVSKNYICQQLDDLTTPVMQSTDDLNQKVSFFPWRFETSFLSKLASSNNLTVLTVFGGVLCEQQKVYCIMYNKLYWSRNRGGGGALECNLTGRCPFFKSLFRKKICILILCFGIFRLQNNRKTITYCARK